MRCRLASRRRTTQDPRVSSAHDNLAGRGLATRLEIEAAAPGDVSVDARKKPIAAGFHRDCGVPGCRVCDAVRNLINARYGPSCRIKMCN
ncbi:hypothetical protein PSAB6_420028 [Paraburkholderia sabiae]|nr:hypothetical protein PSAB6_420028 [Paraburkholderia sabiae]